MEPCYSFVILKNKVRLVFERSKAAAMFLSAASDLRSVCDVTAPWSVMSHQLQGHWTRHVLLCRSDFIYFSKYQQRLFTRFQMICLYLFDLFL
mgnify:CR=1 FL=1